MTPADRYAFEEATKHLAERWADDQAAIARAPKLSWGKYAWVSLPDCPQHVLLFHANDPGEPPEVKTAIARELETRLQDLAAWKEGRRAK
jgi:hypothetical protein